MWYLLSSLIEKEGKMTAGMAIILNPIIPPIVMSNAVEEGESVAITLRKKDINNANIKPRIISIINENKSKIINIISKFLSRSILTIILLNWIINLLTIKI